ncbi:hypothetical protein BH18ACI4_BH18ACI4_19600 [soil metagenome]
MGESLSDLTAPNLNMMPPWGMKVLLEVRRTQPAKSRFCAEAHKGKGTTNARYDAPKIGKLQ